MKFFYVGLLFFAVGNRIQAQTEDSLKDEKVSIHFQTTFIKQYKLNFHAKYSGSNSLGNRAENQNSSTATLYLGAKLWKNASLFFNPEVSGGSGLSGAMGVGASTNGETFRVGNPAPTLYLARLFFTQKFPLGSARIYQASDLNQLAGKTPDQYIAVTVGQISLSDYFDNNQFSHDPRTQFLSWGLMDNGMWDYAANVRGYTPSIVVEYVGKKDELRYAISLLSKTANADDMNWNLSKSNSSTLEYTHHYTLNRQDGSLRLLAFYNHTDMGNYRESIALDPSSPDVTQTRKYGRSKFGIGINLEQNLSSDLGCFLRAGLNDGQNETWCFTEIDQSLSGGLVLNGSRWKRSGDNLGVGFTLSGLSAAHRDYLKAGGKGFILGDGNLRYGLENLWEVDYSMQMIKHIFLTGVYQMILNPGYNLDRPGPVNVFSFRLHVEL